MGLKRSPMLLTTVLKTRRSAASLGSDTEGGGISSSRDSPEATWLRSCSAQVCQDTLLTVKIHEDQHLILELIIASFQTYTGSDVFIQCT